MNGERYSHNTVTKRDLLENFFSKRGYEFCPLECPGAVLIGSWALTQIECSSTLK